MVLSSSLGDVEVVNGFDGRMVRANEYYPEMIKGFYKHGNILSPAEVGCALSHLAIVRRFLASDALFAIIFEDDVLIGENAFEILELSLKLVGQNDILVAGCQQGLEPLGSIFGSRLVNSVECYKIHRDYWPTVKRACAYVLGRGAAEHILAIQQEGLRLADDFGVLCPKGGRLLFCNAFAHPVSLENSTMEKERRLNEGKKPRRLLLRLFDEIGWSFRAKSMKVKTWVRLGLGRYQPIQK